MEPWKALRLLALVGLWVVVPGRCASATFDNPPSAYPHTLDGVFTPLHEWSDIQPIVGNYSYLYLDYQWNDIAQQGTLWLMNDWVKMSQTPDPQWFNYFNISYGADTFEVWIYPAAPLSDEFLLKGNPVAGQAAYGWGPSPNLSSPHTMYEFFIPNFPALPTGSYYTGWECDPIISIGCQRDTGWITSPRAGGGSDSGATPEPASLFLFGSGVIGVWGLMRRKLRRLGSRNTLAAMS